MSRQVRCSGAYVEALELRRLLSGINQLAGIGYLPSDNGTKLQRYDIAAQQWLTPVTLANSPGGATATLVDGQGIYVAYGQSVVRYKLDGTAPTHLINAANPVQDIHSDGNVLFLNHSTGLYARFISISKQTNTIVDTVENYVDSVYGSSISPSANRIFGHRLGISPPDITYMGYDDAGNFTGGGDSPYHGDYSGASRTWVFPQGTKVVDDSGGVYAASNLTRLNSFNTAIDDVTFVGSDVPIVLRANTLTAYSATILPTGSKTLARPATQVLANGSNVIAFNPAANLANGYDVQIVPLADLKAPQPDEPVNPVDLAYAPDDVEVTASGTLLILDKETQSIFRWNSATREYGATIPLVDVPAYMAYSASNNAVYLAYSSGLINRIDLGAANLSETPFATLPSAPTGLAAAGQYVFAADGSGAWHTHYTFGSGGNAISAVDWNRYSAEYVWSPANGMMYFFRDDTSPNDLHAEVIGPDGTISSGLESPLHTSEGFIHPIRVSPDGGIVVLGSGMVHDGKTLARLAGGLGNAVADVAWLNGTVYTVRSIAGYAQFQQWTGSTYAPGFVQQVEGTPNRLLSVGGSLVGIYTPASGVPQFRVMGADLLPVPPEGVETIIGTTGNDVILIDQVNGQHQVTVNGVVTTLSSGTTKLFVDGDWGHDQIAATANVTIRLQMTGSAGNDRISGGAADDELSGGLGYDRVFGGFGNDFLIGGGHNDYLNGEAGNDLMIGGGGNDRLIDTVGRDHYIGGLGNDVFVSRDTRQNIHNNPDTLSGGPGFDQAQVDVTPSADNLSSIDELLA